MDFRTLACLAIACAVAGAAVSFEITMTDYWVPLSLGIFAVVFAAGAFMAAIEDSESQLLPVLAALIGIFAVIQGVGAMNDLKDTRDQVDELQQQLEQLSPELQNLPDLAP